MAGARKGRGRLPLIRLLPRAAAHIVAWAAQELQNLDRTQTDIYEEFYGKLEALKREHRGELEFDIPSFQAFNRYSTELATIANRMEEAREMAQAIAQRFEASEEDDLTRIAAMAIKSLVMEIVVKKGKAGVDPKDAAALGTALRAASQAEGVSTARRQKVQKEFSAGVEQAVETAVREKGMSAETAEAIKAQILGVKS